MSIKGSMVHYAPTGTCPGMGRTTINMYEIMLHMLTLSKIYSFLPRLEATILQTNFINDNLHGCGML